MSLTKRSPAYQSWISKEDFDQHDCHNDPDDGCQVCADYFNQSAVESYQAETLQSFQEEFDRLIDNEIEQIQLEK